MKKSKRQQIVLDIVSKYEVDTQEELAVILQNKGITATQATVSRDIKELGLIKTKGEERKFRYMLPLQEKNQNPDAWLHFRTVVLSAENAENLVVIKTLAANGNVVAAFIDSQEIEGVLGTIAGDDTLLIITKNTEIAQSIVENVRDKIKL